MTRDIIIAGLLALAWPAVAQTGPAASGVEPPKVAAPVAKPRTKAKRVSRTAPATPAMAGKPRVPAAATSGSATSATQ